MAQLLVRNIDDLVVARLRRRAAEHGVSAEEEHRRILRHVLLRAGGATRTLKDHLAAMPDVGEDSLFERPTARIRSVRL
jgi:plasmid stability protein